jgi:hypothetical protein
MGNALDNALIIRDTATLVFRNLATSVNKLQIKYTAVDPNGVVTAQIGSIASGPTGMWINTDGGTVWATVITSDVFSLPPDEFYVDQTATPQAALYRIYTSVELAIIGAELSPEFFGNTNPYTIRLREGQLHAWNDGAGIPVGSGRKISITCRARSGAELESSGTFPVGAGFTLSLTGVVFSLSGSLVLPAGNQIRLDEVNFFGNGHTISCVFFFAQRTTCRDVKFAGIPAPGFFSSVLVAGFSSSRMIWSDSGVAPTFFSGVTTLFIIGCSIEIAEDDFVFMTPTQPLLDPTDPPVSGLGISDTSFFADQIGAGAARLFNTGVTDLSITAGTDFSFLYSGGGSIDFGIHALNAGSAEQMKTFGVDPKYLPEGTWHDLDAAGQIVQIQDFSSSTQATPEVKFSFLSVGTTGGMSLAFKLTTAWPAAGTIDIEFPPGFDVSAAQLAVASGVDGVINGTAFSSATALLKSNGNFEPQGALTALANMYSITISAGPDPLNFLTKQIQAITDETNLVVRAPIFPGAAGAGYTYSIQPYFGISGGLSVSVSGQVVTITRDGLGAPLAPGTECAVSLRGIKNPLVPGDTHDFLVAAFSGAPVNGQQDTGRVNGVEIV